MWGKEFKEILKNELDAKLKIYIKEDKEAIDFVN